MSLAFFLKEKADKLPYAVGALLAKVPYGMRPPLRSSFQRANREMALVERLSQEGRRQFVFDRVKAVACHAVRNVEFYRQFYGDYGVDPHRMGDFADIDMLPIVDKAIMQDVPMEDRSATVASRSKVNTGGSSGKPLSFYIEPSAMGHEWAHMLSLWKRIGFTTDQPKIVFSGLYREGELVSYDSVRHSFLLNIASDWQDLADAILADKRARQCRFLHGYPSAMFDFVLWLEKTGHPLIDTFRKNIQGIMLSSEYPVPHLRAAVEEALEAKSVSWYGHTERAVLAGERTEAYNFEPLLSYGFAEAVEIDGAHQLIGTSYYNFASPLIRYNTEDTVLPTFEGGLLSSFRIDGGRKGDFILDAQNNKIFLTAIIFGRHHALFDHVSHVQVRQEQAGKATIVYSTHEDLAPADAAQMFDAKAIDVHFDFERRERPYRTKLGKVPLLVSSRLVD
ncbi:phenylacetate--CoA ligase family protein [Sphingomicrobium marinum]|uniref:hypothetical protein n=1 Tax=Sphingomicrobium marinum TaxID=1227950 RepID=UPI002240B008|nr:hypothetical protein [Sphingomicrobium marinum]